MRKLLDLCFYTILLTSALTARSEGRLPLLRQLYDTKSMSGPEVAWSLAAAEFQKAKIAKDYHTQAEIWSYLLIDGQEPRELEKLSQDPYVWRRKLQKGSFKDQEFMLNFALDLQLLNRAPEPSPDAFRKLYLLGIAEARQRGLPDVEPILVV